MANGGKGMQAHCWLEDGPVHLPAGLVHAPDGLVHPPAGLVHPPEVESKAQRAGEEMCYSCQRECDVSVVGAMEMGNNVRRVGLKCTSLAFRASLLRLHNVGFPDVTTVPTTICLCDSLPQRSVQTTTLVPYIIIIIN